MAINDVFIELGGHGQIDFLAGQPLLVYQVGQTWIPQKTVDGIASRTLERTLSRNALVRHFEVVAGARRADATSLANSGQVRLAHESGNTKIVIVDFGMLRTISGVGASAGGGGPPITICRLFPWLGADFSGQHIYYQDCEAGDIDSLMLVSAETNLFEVRTERVKLKLMTQADLDAIANRVFLEFPDLPSDLDLRVNNLPVWVAPGPAQPNARGWSAEATQRIDLTSALSALTGDPTDESALPLQIVLASRVPGVLTLTEDTSVSDVSYLSRILFDDQAELNVEFTEEGVIDIALPLPEWVNGVEEVRLTLTGTVPPERILPPVGPQVATLPSSADPLADLILDVDHAGAARLPAQTGLVELTALRLPLRAGTAGAEVRAVLFEGTAQSPGASLETAASTPVSLLPAAAAGPDAWVTFEFPDPVALPAGREHWAVVVVSRGSAAWSLGEFDSAAAAVPLRRGQLTGPWHALPAVLPAVHVGARIRQVGRAAKDAPVAPLLLEVVGKAPGGELPVTPRPKGTRAVWTPTSLSTATPRPSLVPAKSVGSKAVTLRFTSRMTGRITLSDIDIVATK